MNNKYLLNKRDFFKENGYVIYKNILNKKNTSYYLKDLKKFALDKSQGKNLFLQGYRGLSKWKKIKQIRRNPKIKKIAISLLGTNIKNFGSELFAKKGPGTLPVPLHQDDAYWCSNGGRGLTLWLALTSVSKKNGGIFYLQGSHKKGLMPHQMAKTKKFSQRVIPKKWKESGPNITATSLPDDYVHFSQPRSLTVREWARLQMFPDWYEFEGIRTTGGARRAGMPDSTADQIETPKYTQIGNAVPVKLASLIGGHLKYFLQ